MQNASSARATCCEGGQGMGVRVELAAPLASAGVAKRKDARTASPCKHCSMGWPACTLLAIPAPAATHTCACRSASLNTATEGMPRRRAVASTRHAISPRLATSSLLIAGLSAAVAAAAVAAAAALEEMPALGARRPQAAPAACRPRPSRRPTARVLVGWDHRIMSGGGSSSRRAATRPAGGKGGGRAGLVAAGACLALPSARRCQRVLEAVLRR